MSIMKFSSLTIIITAVLLISSTMQAYPELQKFSQTHSRRTVNCAMCHVNSDGPDGLAFGQVGGLDSVQMEQLKEARRAQQPGMSVNSPILNAFGNKLVSTLGVRRLVEIKKDPASLYFYMKDAGDLDNDGIIDAEEYLDGTDPNNRHHGDPWKLFRNNLVTYLFEIVMILLATLSGIYGLTNILHSFAIEMNDRTH